MKDRPTARPEPAILATLLRGPDQAMRVTMESLDGHRFAKITTWRRGPRSWEPVAFVTVRAREMDQVIAALESARDALAGDRASSARRPAPSPGRVRPPARHDGQARRPATCSTPPWQGPGGLPLEETEAEAFDEFKG